MASFTIRLHNLRFFAYHGVFEEERSVGNEFEVDLSLKIKAPKQRIASIEETVNYAEAYRIVKDLFSKPEPLLESLAMDLAEALERAFPTLKKISVQITKLHPPIVSFVGAVSVTYEKRCGRS